MKCLHIKKLMLTDSRGGVLVLVAIMLTVLVGVGALAIDVGYISTTKNELQNIADAAALAATGELGRFYIESSDGSYDPSNEPAIIAAATTVGLSNHAAHVAITVSQVTVGRWDGLTHTFTGGGTYPNAVKVSALRDTGSGNGPITALFAGIFNISSFDVQADAVAALTGQAKIFPGEDKLPIGVSENWFVDTDGDGKGDGCRSLIHFDVTGTSCAGWHTYDGSANTTVQTDNIWGTILAYEQPDGTSLESPEVLAARLAAELEPDDPAAASAAEIWVLDNYRTVLDNNNEGLAWLLIKHRDSPAFLNYINNESKVGPYTSPGADAGIDSYNFIGGVVGALLNEGDPMPDLFDFFKVRDLNNDPLTWTTTVPVYKDNFGSCINPNQSRLIVGAADIIVSSVNAPPNSSLDIEITCGFEDVRGGGGTGGVVGTIPNIVK